MQNFYYVILNVICVMMHHLYCQPCLLWKLLVFVLASDFNARNIRRFHVQV